MATTPHIPPIVWLAGAFGIQEVVSRRKRREAADRDEEPKPRRFSRFLALAKLSASVGFIADAAKEMSKAKTTIDPTHPEATTTLVTTGIFRLTRNPIYLGMAGLLAANALRRRSALAWLAVPAFMAAIDRWQIPQEEEALAARFGSAWQAYRDRVPRWIGLPSD